MCKAQIKLWFGLAQFGLAQFGGAWLGWAFVWRGLVRFGISVKLNYLVSLLTRGWVGGGNQN